MPGVDRVLEKVGGLTALLGADLNISALDGPNAFKLMDGVAAAGDVESGRRAEGVKTTLAGAGDVDGDGTDDIV